MLKTEYMIALSCEYLTGYVDILLIKRKSGLERAKKTKSKSNYDFNGSYDVCGHINSLESFSLLKNYNYI